MDKDKKGEHRKCVKHIKTQQNLFELHCSKFFNFYRIYFIDKVDILLKVCFELFVKKKKLTKISTQ